MYHAHFGMHTDPFPLSPKLVFVYQSRAFGETMAHLIYGVEQEEDIVLITGGIAAGVPILLLSDPDPLALSFPSASDGVAGLTFVEAVITSSGSDGAWTTPR